jgi:hypothetical protein
MKLLAWGEYLTGSKAEVELAALDWTLLVWVRSVIWAPHSMSVSGW